MLNGKRVIAVIPARGGSKSVPGKNIRPLGRKPLHAWSIEVARQLSEIDRVIVSTNDLQIASVGKAHGAEVFPCPAHLATNESLVIDALKDLFRTFREEGETPEWVILLEATCPLRTADDVRDCLKIAAEGGYTSVATFKEAELNPHRAWRQPVAASAEAAQRSPVNSGSATRHFGFYRRRCHCRGDVVGELDYPSSWQ